MTAFGMVKLTIVLLGATCALALALRVFVMKRFDRLSQLILAVLVLCVWGVLSAFVIEPNWIKVEHVKVRDRALADVLGDTKIVHITDIHLHDGIGYRERAMVHKVNALKPDIIFFTGDLVDNLSQVDDARALLGELKAAIGIFAVPGNTDHIVMDSRSFEREFEPAGIQVLVNESIPVRLRNGKTLWVTGFDDPKYRFARVEESLSRVPEGAPMIGLAHAPNIFPQAVKEGVNLLLVGDTHGGQVGIPFLVRLSDYANRTIYIRGKFSENGTLMYVNRGIGMKTLPIRFLCRPEIAVIEVKR